MEKVYGSMKLEMSIMASSKTIRKMERENLDGQMEMYTMDSS